MDPCRVLGIDVSASEHEIRAAYLRKVKEHPPDTSPEEFERIRDAYETLRDPRRRASLLFAADPEAPMTSLLEGLRPERRFVGPDPWLSALNKARGARTPAQE